MNKEQELALRNLKIAKGQLEATISMIEEGRYCVDISNQILATASLLKKANLEILKQHIEHCVVEAVNSGEQEEKIDEIIKILGKAMGK